MRNSKQLGPTLQPSTIQIEKKPDTSPNYINFLHRVEKPAFLFRGILD